MPEINKYMVLSDQHLAVQDRTALEESNGEMIWSAPHKYGWFIFCDEGMDSVPHNFSPGFVKMLEYGREHGCEFVMTYDNGPVDQELLKLQREVRQ